jgi:hypothetical protein
MDTLHLAPQQPRRTTPAPKLAPRRRAPRRAPLVAPDSDATLVIDVVYLGHLNRQAMLDAQALLRGDDDGGEQVW